MIENQTNHIGQMGKHLMTALKGNNDFCFPEALSVSRSEAEVNIKVEGKQNLLFHAGTVIKCFVIVPNSKIEKNMRRNRLLGAGWLTNLPRFQGARPGHVRVESCFLES